MFYFVLIQGLTLYSPGCSQAPPPHHNSEFRDYSLISPCLTGLVISSLWVPLGITVTQTSAFHNIKFHLVLSSSSVSFMTLTILGKPYGFDRTWEDSLDLLIIGNLSFRMFKLRKVTFCVYFVQA